MRLHASVPGLVLWAAGLLCIVAAALVLSASTLAAVVLVVAGFGLVGAYWVREHPKGAAHSQDSGHGGHYLGGEGGDGVGGGDGGGGGGT
jgi:hypothetical protein